MRYKVIVTGSTGMVGKGVLLECLEDDSIEEVLVINRNPVEIKHKKLRELLLEDFFKIEELTNEMKGYDACFFCLGVSSVGMKEQEYSKVTYDLCKAFSDEMIMQNPNSSFIYVSGQGTDETEKGKLMWARVKGKTENMILNKGFQDAYAFRPGAIIPKKAVKSKTKWVNAIYFLIRPLMPLFELSKSVVTSEGIGKAMIHLLEHPIEKKVVLPKEMNRILRSQK